MKSVSLIGSFGLHCDDSPVRQLQHFLGQPSALNGDRRCGIVDLAQFGSGQVNRSGAEVFFEAFELARAWNRDDPGLLREQPGDRDLRWRRVLSDGVLAVGGGTVGPVSPMQPYPIADACKPPLPSNRFFMV